MTAREPEQLMLPFPAQRFGPITGFDPRTDEFVFECGCRAPKMLVDKDPFAYGLTNFPSYVPLTRR